MTRCVRGMSQAAVGFVVAVLVVGSASASAEPPPDRIDELRQTRFGTFGLDLRLRYELADVDGSDNSHAVTLRSRVGFTTKEWQSLSLHVEGEAIQAFDDDHYFDGVGSPNGRSVVADPEDAEVNQAYLRWSPEGWGRATIGRQRIILDDARFIGNVGWRQNEQTFDAVRLETPLGRDDLRLQYVYLDEAHRIFGDKGPPGRRDYDSNSHLAHLAYTALPVDVVFFGYLLRFDDFPVFSTDSYGVRLKGNHALHGEWRLAWFGSLAYQRDARKNPVDYHALYGALEAGAVSDSLGAFGAGYEHLGSDGGAARFVTPLATGHKFNGWADAFLDNGGLTGLRDLYVYAAPRLPWGLKGRVVLHQFWTAENSDSLGWELDASLGRKLGRRTTALAKLAFFDGENGRANQTRFWLQMGYAF